MGGRRLELFAVAMFARSSLSLFRCEQTLNINSDPHKNQKMLQVTGVVQSWLVRLNVTLKALACCWSVLRPSMGAQDMLGYSVPTSEEKQHSVSRAWPPWDRRDLYWLGSSAVAHSKMCRAR